ncbi:MAG TPA: nicotinamide-nucleotide amidohydrolase family protein [Candidatus Humimicrobiaceae bacterium]|nr:nicotinamide-nucleotide amidohydrolase family protein [Candidatus Humimicrobiaceae bacterium]
MNLSIISIGTELNLGLILNENSRYIAERITELGIECKYMYTVSDDSNEISSVMKHSLEFSDLVIITGGLGPTDDDVTRNAVASVLNQKLIRDRDLDVTSLKFIKEPKSQEIIDRLLRQSFIPEGAVPFKPEIGSASGFQIELEGNKYIFCIPGVPKEMRSMFEKDVVPFLKRRLTDKDLEKNIFKIKKSTLLTTDISETEIEEKIKEIVEEAGNIDVRIGITANPGLIKIILVAQSQDDNEARMNLKKIEKKISDKLGNYFYGKEDTLISDNLKEALARIGGNLTISAAESITGGLVSSIITDTPGSSKFFLGSIISYSDYSKMKLLDIDKNVLKKYGAVSREVCLDMAKKVRDLFDSDYALGVTGYAGPESESGKLGLVYCCIVGPDRYERVFEKKFAGTRYEIKFKTVQFILNELRAVIIKKK